MIRRPPRSTRTDTRFPYTTLFRSRLAYFLMMTGSDSPEDFEAFAISTTPSITNAAIAPNCTAPQHGPRPLPLFLKMLWQRSEEHTSELQSLMRISYAVFCLKKKKKNIVTSEQVLTYTLTIKN